MSAPPMFIMCRKNGLAERITCNDNSHVNSTHHAANESLCYFLFIHAQMQSCSPSLLVCENIVVFNYSKVDTHAKLTALFVVLVNSFVHQQRNGPNQRLILVIYVCLHNVDSTCQRHTSLCSVINGFSHSLSSTRLDSTRLDSTRLDSTRLDSTRLDSTRLDSTRLDSTRLDSTRLDSTRLDSTRLDSTRLDSTRLDSTRLDSTRLDSVFEGNIQRRPSNYSVSLGID